MNEPMGTSEIESLIGAYALDAVEPDERQAIEAHLATCPRCRAELADHLEVASMLAYSGAPAPERLWARIASSLEEAPPALRLEVVDRPRASARRRSRVLVALAAAAVVLIVGLGVQVLHQGGQIDRLNTAAHQSALSRAAEQALSDPASQKLKLTSPNGSKGSAIAVLTDSGTGYLMPANLPALPKGRTYQLWGVTPTQVVSLGLLGPDPQLNAFPAHGHFTALAVTDEVAGGVTQSKHAPVISGRPI